MNESNRSMWIVLALISAVIVVLLCAFAIFYLYANRPTSVETPSSIETVVAETLTAVVSPALPSGTAILETPTTPLTSPTSQPSATQQPPTSTPTAPPTIPPEDPRQSLGAPSWQDKFDDDRNWTLFDDDCFKSEIEDGRYIMESRSAPSPTCWEVTWPKIQDFYLETTVITTEACQGTDRFGLFFRGPDTTQGYLYGLTCDGQYGMARWDPDGEKWDFFVEFTPSVYINSGPEQTNRIGVMARGKQFGLYINGYLVSELEDNTYRDEGLIGFFIGATSTEDFTIQYDELAYWEIE